MSEKISRRTFLKLSGAVVVAGALAACSGGGSSSGSSPDLGTSDPAGYYDVGGLWLKQPDSFGCLAGKFYVDLYFRNPTDSPVNIICGDAFKSCRFNGTPVTPIGFRSMTFPRRLCTIEPTGSDGSQCVRLYLNNDFTIPLPNKSYPYHFEFHYNHRKAVCDGTYRPLGDSTSQVTVVDG